MIYIGDSANYQYVLHEVGDPFKGSDQNKYWIDNLQRSMLDQIGSSTQDALQQIRSEDDQRLRDQGVFQYPEKSIRDELIRVFFDYSYLACPIFYQVDFMRLYKADSLSPLTLNAVFFMATLHCSEALLAGMGFPNRYLAGLTFYRRAKALYDADYESDGIATVQAAILLSHRCDGPTEQKDTWHWLGIATGLAQSLGMHRRKSYSVLQSSCCILWRRIWWVLYINDVHHAAIYGRPPHINPDFSDIIPLTEADFQDYEYSPFTVVDEPLLYESKLYLINLVGLSCRVARCIIAKYSSNDDPDTKRRWYDELVDFQNTLPPRFTTLPHRVTLDRGFWPSVLQLYHLEYQVVFYRGLADRADHSNLVTLAGKVTRILEDMLASGTLYRAPSHILPAIFSSTIIHILQSRKNGMHVGVLSEHRARLELSILRGFQDTWPHVLYIRHLLERLLKTSSSRESETDEQQEHCSGLEEPAEMMFPLGLVEGSLDEHVFNLLSTPTMPMFLFNSLDNEAGFNP